jgi:arachidonate 15-lipoxygenase
LDKYEYDNNLASGIPVAAEFFERDKPDARWGIKIVQAIVKIRKNLDMFEKQFGKKFKFSNPLPRKKLPEILSLFRLLASDKKNSTQHLRNLFNYYNPDRGFINSGNLGRATLPIENEYQSIFTTFPKPELIQVYKSDFEFGYSFVGGPNPQVFSKLSTLPSNFSVDTSRIAMHPAFEGNTFEAAVSAGKIFIASYPEFNDSFLKQGQHPSGTDKHFYAPFILLIAVNEVCGLLPIAVQVGPDPNVFETYYPRIQTQVRFYASQDEALQEPSWQLAKYIVAAAHFMNHQMIAHLADTHLVIEAITIATRNQLSEEHCVYKLLSPHFEGTLPINALAVTKLIRPGEAVDRLVGTNFDSNIHIVKNARLNSYNFREYYLPTRLKNRGVDNTEVLKHYPYRDFGTLIWNSIQSFVTGYLNVYYPHNESVEKDSKLQNWCREINLLGKINGFSKTPEKILSKEELIGILTMVIYTAGPNHSAVNFAQKSDMSYLPASPLSGYIPAPKKGQQISQADIAAFLPPIDVALRQMQTMIFLGSVYHTKLGFYPKNYFSQEINILVKEFQKNLVAIEQIMNLKNKLTASLGGRKYEHLLPSKITQSINI